LFFLGPSRDVLNLHEQLTEELELTSDRWKQDLPLRVDELSALSRTERPKHLLRLPSLMPAGARHRRTPLPRCSRHRFARWGLLWRHARLLQPAPDAPAQRAEDATPEGSVDARQAQPSAQPEMRRAPSWRP